VDKLDTALLVGQATVVDVHHRAAREDITAADLIGALPCERLLICTGWDNHYGTTEYFTSVPGLSQAAADAILAGGVRLLGIDSPNIHASEWDSLHRQLLGKGVVLLEGLAGLTPLVGRQVTLIVAPLLLTGADGAPARVFALA
jgi:kynurenine formamidase